MRFFYNVCPSMARHWRLPPIFVVPSGLKPGGFPSWKVAKGIPPCHLSHSATSKLNETHTTWTSTTSVAALSGMAKQCAISESSANHRAPFQHRRPSSNLPETYWLLSNVLCWCHMSTIFHAHPSKISALSKSGTTLHLLLHVKQPKSYCWKTFNYGRELHRKDMM